MPTKIFFVQDPKSPFAPSKWNGATPIALDQIPAISKNEIAANSNILLLAPNALKQDPAVQGILDAGFPLTTAFFQTQEQADQLVEPLRFLASENRTTGVKDLLTKGSVIYSETFFNASKAGERLDLCFRFAREKLDPKRALEVWGSLHALLFLGIRALPDQGEKGTGERVDVQIGADSTNLTFTIRFDLPSDHLPDLRRHSILETPRNAVDFFEFRYLQKAKKAEILGVCFMNTPTTTAVEVQSFHPAAALETNQDVKDYTFQTFGALSGSAQEEKRVIKGGFKKKFSDQVSLGADAKETEEVTRISADKNISEKETIIKADNTSAPAAKTVVISGNANLGKEKSQALLESKIQSLEGALKQREELIAKLNKEIEEIKDPMKMGVITGIKDNQLEGLKDNITRLQGELAESQKREKEFMGVVDKAIQVKDDAVKRLKDLETKLRQSQESNNSKVITVEKQLEEQKRQNKEYLKKISQLTEQLQAAGKKAA